MRQKISSSTLFESEQKSEAAVKIKIEVTK